MIKEFAFSISNRHHFQDNTKTADWMGLDTNTFVSLYDYDEYVIEYYGNSLIMLYISYNIIYLC